MKFGCVYPRRVQDGALELMDAEASTAAVVGSPILSNRYEDLKIWAALKTGVADSRPRMRRNEDPALEEEPRARHPCDVPTGVCQSLFTTTWGLCKHKQELVFRVLKTETN